MIQDPVTADPDYILKVLGAAFIGLWFAWMTWGAPGRKPVDFFVRWTREAPWFKVVARWFGGPP